MKKALGQTESVEKYYSSAYLKEHKYYLTNERTRAEVDFLLSSSDYLPGSVCDVACGNGRHLEEFAKRGVDKGLGVEPNKELFGKAKDNLGKIFKLENKSFEEWETNEKFDLVYTLFSSTCYLLKNDEMFCLVKKMIEATKPGGKVVIDTENIFPMIGQLEVEYINRNRRLKFDPEKMTIDSEEVIDGKILRISRRYYMASELIYIFKLAGVNREKIKVYGGFDGKDYKVSSDRIILVASIK